MSLQTAEPTLAQPPGSGRWIQGAFGPRWVPERQQVRTGVIVSVIAGVTVVVVGVLAFMLSQAYAEVPSDFPVTTGTKEFEARYAGDPPRAIWKAPATEIGEPSSEPASGTPRARFDALSMQLNAALRTKDRAAFFAHVSGAALEPLNRWWDNMDALGWSTGSISQSGGITREAGGTMASVNVRLGSAMTFGMSIPRGSGLDGAGMTYIQSFTYVAGIQLGETSMIVTFVPYGGTRPWDVDNLIAVQGNGVVLAGVESERRMLEATLARAEETSAWARADHEAMGGVPSPMNGFMVFMTMNDARAQSWFGALKEGSTIEVAGQARPAYLPDPDTPGVTPSVMTGDSTAGSFVVIGPGAADPLSYLATVFAHEYVHAIQAASTPWTYGDEWPPTASIEGWAKFQDRRYTGGGKYLSSGEAFRDINHCYGKFFTGQIPTDDALLSSDSWCHYELAGTLYAYIEDQGLNPLIVANTAKSRAVDPLTAARGLTGGEGVSLEGWASWLDEYFG